MKKFNKDSIKNILFVTFFLSIVASLLVSFLAISLRDLQEQNRVFEKRKNILEAAGIIEPGEEVSFADLEEKFKDVKEIVIDFDSGDEVEGIDAESYDPLKASKDPAASIALSKAEDVPGIKRRENQGVIYEIIKNDTLETIVLPIRGYGLWSTLYGFIALDGTGKVVKGITFYQHAETPGLGGEVDNIRWKKMWVDKVAYDEADDLKIRVLKAGKAKPDSKYEIDGLSGATITTVGVDHMISFWLGEEKGYGKYLKKNIFDK